MKIKRVMQAENRYGKSTGVARVIKASTTSRVESGSLVFYNLSRSDTAGLEVVRGLTLQVTGVIQAIPEDVSPDSFDAYLKETGIHYRFEQTTGTKVVRDASFFMKLCHRANNQFQDYLRLGEPLDQNLSQIYIAMLLGQKAELSQDQTDRFRTTGTMHLFAISGLHIGVIATVIWQMLLICRMPPKATPFIGLPLLYFYVEITGAAPSAIRAFLMVTFFWFSIAVQRQRSPLAALAASAVFVLIIQPMQLWQMGFQLSYLVVISILLFGLPLREQLWSRLRPYKYIPQTDWSMRQKWHYRLADKLMLLFVISFSAWLASAPLSAGFFGFIAPYAILINIFLVNLAALVISGGVIALSLALVGLPGLAAFLNHSAWVGISLMDGLVSANLQLPFATLQCEDFPKSMSYLGVFAYLASLVLIGNIRNQLLRFCLPPLLVMLALAAGILLGTA